MCHNNIKKIHRADLIASEYTIINLLSVDNILQEPELLESFRQFCKKDHSSENIEFIIDVSNYKYLLNIGDIAIYEKLVYIIYKYIENDSECEINIEESERKKILCILETDSDYYTIFDNCYDQIVGNMTNDILKRYIMSSEYGIYINYEEANENDKLVVSKKSLRGNILSKSFRTIKSFIIGKNKYSDNPLKNTKYVSLYKREL